MAYRLNRNSATRVTTLRIVMNPAGMNFLLSFATFMANQWAQLVQHRCSAEMYLAMAQHALPDFT